MPTFLGFQIIDDPASVAKRLTAQEGFIEPDERLLKELRVLIDEGGQLKRNPKLSADPQEIRDFLQWAAGDKKPPMPPLAVKLLCLKRASILSSTHSAGIGDKPRTGDNTRIAEIDALLKSTGVKDVNITNPEQCKTIQSDKYVAPPLPGSTDSNNSKGATTTGGCTTHVHCDNSAVVALLQEIMKKIDCLEGMAPPSLEEATTDLELFKARLLELQKNMDALHNRTPLPNGRPTGGEEPGPGPIDPILRITRNSNDDGNDDGAGSSTGTGDPKSVQSATSDNPTDISAIMNMLTDIQGRLGTATQQVSNLPSNYKLVVNQLMEELNPAITSMATEIRTQISAMDATVKEIKSNTTEIKDELLGLRTNVQRTLSSTQAHDSTLANLVDIIQKGNLSFQASLNELQMLIDALGTYIGTLQHTNGDGRKNASISDNESILTEIVDLRKRLDELLNLRTDHQTTISTTILKQDDELIRLRQECHTKDKEIFDLTHRLKECNEKLGHAKENDSEEVVALKSNAVKNNSEEVVALKSNAVKNNSEEVVALKSNAVKNNSEEVVALKSNAVKNNNEEVVALKSDAVKNDSEEVVEEEGVVPQNLQRHLVNPNNYNDKSSMPQPSLRFKNSGRINFTEKPHPISPTHWHSTGATKSKTEELVAEEDAAAQNPQRYLVNTNNYNDKSSMPQPSLRFKNSGRINFTEKPHPISPAHWHSTGATKSKAEEHVADGSAADGAAADSHAADGSAADESVAQETVADVSVAKETPADELAAEEPAKGATHSPHQTRRLVKLANDTTPTRPPFLYRRLNTKSKRAVFGTQKPRGVTRKNYPVSKAVKPAAEPEPKPIKPEATTPSTKLLSIAEQKNAYKIFAQHLKLIGTERPELMKQEMIRLFNKILEYYNSGTIDESQIKDIETFVKLITDTPTTRLAEFRHAMERLGYSKKDGNVTQDNYAQYINEMLKFFSIPLTMPKKRSGTRRRKEKSQRRTRKL